MRHVKPKWGGRPLGVVQNQAIRNYNRNGIPLPVLDLPMWEGAGNKAFDVSGKGNHGTATNAKWRGPGMGFDGTGDYVTVIDSDSISTDIETFSIEIRFNNAENLYYATDQVGSLLSKYNTTTLTGLTLDVLRTGIPGLFFGINEGVQAATWTQKAPKLVNETILYAICGYNDKIYAGTYPNGNLYEWNGTDAWVQKAPKLGDETRIYALVVLDGELYGSTYPGGKLYKWNGTNAWTSVAGTLGAEQYLMSLAVFNGTIYGGTCTSGFLYEWNGVDAWTKVADALDAETRIYTLVVLGGYLYGTTFPNGKLYRWNGTDAWVNVSGAGAGVDLQSAAVYNGKIYAGGSTNGKLYEWNGTDAWVEKAPQLGAETNIKTLCGYNGKLYGGTSPGCRLYEWNNSNAWAEKCATPGTEGTAYCLLPYDGKLYVSTGSGGTLQEWTSGIVVSTEEPLETAWNHLVAVKDSTTVKLYINGVLINTSSSFVAADYDLDNSTNLTIGSGFADSYNGEIDFVRMYPCALSTAQVHRLYADPYLPYRESK